MKMKGRKILIVVLIITLLFIGNIYTSFNGNPIKIRQTKVKAEEYVKEKYPNAEVGFVKPWYNFKFGCYGATITTKIGEPITFYIEFYKNGNVYDNYIESKLEHEVTKLVSPQIENVLPNIQKIEGGVSLRENHNFSEDTVFTKDLPIDILLDIRWVDDTITKEQFVNKVVEVRDILKDEKIQVGNYFFSCKFNNGKESYVLSLDKQYLNMNPEELLKSDRINQFSEQ